jgi:hypothetical protein
MKSHSRLTSKDWAVLRLAIESLASDRYRLSKAFGERSSWQEVMKSLMIIDEKVESSAQQSFQEEQLFRHGDGNRLVE